MFRQQQYHKTTNPNSPCYDCPDSVIYCPCCQHFNQLLNDLDYDLDYELVEEMPVPEDNMHEPKPEQIVFANVFNDLLQRTVKSELKENYVKPAVQEQLSVAVEPEVKRQIQTTVQPAVQAAVRQTIAETSDSTNEQILEAVKSIALKFNDPIPVFTV